MIVKKYDIFFNSKRLAQKVSFFSFYILFSHNKEKKGESDVRLLIFADLHQVDAENIKKIKKNFDVIIFLGDIDAVVIRRILEKFSDKPAYAVLGNHDNDNVFKSVNNLLMIEKAIFKEHFIYPLMDMHLKEAVVDDITFVGLQGSVKYKDKCIGYTQGEALSLDIPPANILFSHDSGYHHIPYENYDTAHEGLRAISDYLEKKKPKYHIFGHHHKDLSFKQFETDCFCVYGCSVFDYEKGNMKKMF